MSWPEERTIPITPIRMTVMTADQIRSVMNAALAYIDANTAPETRTILMTVHEGVLLVASNRFLYPGGDKAVGEFMIEAGLHEVAKAQERMEHSDADALREADSTKGHHG